MATATCGVLDDAKVGYSGDADTNFGTATDLSGYSQGTPDTVFEEFFIRFDLASFPAATTPTSAYITLRDLGDWNSGSAYVRVNRILDANTWVEAQVTFNNRATGTAWAGSAGCGTSGTDYDATACHTSDVAVPSGQAFNITLNAAGLTDLYYQKNTSNQGWLFREIGAFEYFHVASVEHATSSYRPTITIEYDEGGGDPEGSLIGGKLLRGGLLTHGVLVRG